MVKNKINIDEIIYDGNLIKSLNVTIDKVNNEAYLYRWLGNEYVIRKVGKQYDLSTNQLILLEKNILKYYKLLKTLLPTNLPKVFFTKIDRQQNIILIVTEYFPKGKIIELENTFEKIEYFKAICMLAIKLAGNRSNLYLNELICSIDPNPDNFFIGYRNKLIYNDFSPPLFRKTGKWVEFRRLDEMHAEKSDKEKRYFTGLNLLLTFINKTRVHLPPSDYLKFVEWLSDEIKSSHFGPKNSLKKFPDIFDEIYVRKTADFQKLEKYAVLRDLLRFSLSFRRDLTNIQIKEIYSKSKRIDGVIYLENKIKQLDKSGGEIQ